MKNQQKNKVQMTGVATATVNGNGNGNGKKAKVETGKPETNVRIDENFDTEIKITPHFDFLSAKGVEMFTDMGNLENAKLFLDGLAMQLDNDSTELTGLLMILDAISRKLEGEDSDYLGAEDYINWLKDYIFNWMVESGDCQKAFIEAVRSGNFVISGTRDHKGDVWAEGIYPPTYKVKAKENGLRAEINALAETVKSLQAQLNGLGNSDDVPVTGVKPQAASSGINLEAIRNANVEELGGVISAVMENEALCPSISNGIFDGIVKCIPPHIEDKDTDFTPEFLARCIGYENKKVLEQRLGSLGYTISIIINSPELPKPVYKALLTALTETLPETEGQQKTAENIADGLREHYKRRSLKLAA